MALDNWPGNLCRRVGDSPRAKIIIIFFNVSGKEFPAGKKWINNMSGGLGIMFFFAIFDGDKL
jgi:hypothetical protein